MALYWYWKNIAGQMIFKNGRKHQIYSGPGCNCLGVIAYHEQDRGWVVYGEFWRDTEHLEKMLGIRKGWNGKCQNCYKDLKKVRLNTFFKEDTDKIAKCFAKAHINIEFYYKEVKTKKKK